MGLWKKPANFANKSLPQIEKKEFSVLYPVLIILDIKILKDFLIVNIAV